MNVMADSITLAQVDSVAKTASNFYEKNSGFLKSHSDFHSKNLTHFKEARDAYIQQAKDAIAFLKVTPCCVLWRRRNDGMV